MYVIAGLGNPGLEYNGTRHNIGFCAIDELAARNQIIIDTKKHKALCGKGMINGQKAVLAKPQTYMNLSGESIREIADFYKVEPDHIIILFDDISLEPGQIRVRTKGSAGGHNGIKSIISHLGTMDFPRVKIGIGAKPAFMDLADYVLSRFSQGEQKLVEDGLLDGVRAVELILESGIDQAMNRFNGKQR